MSTLLLLQIGVIGLLIAVPLQVFPQTLLCLRDPEMVDANYRLQKPVGFFTGEIPDNAHVLRIYLQPGKDREVFALQGVFSYKDDAAKDEWISPVFVCDQSFPVWYQLPDYVVACPRMPDEPVLVVSLSKDLFQARSFALTYWTDVCVARRRVEYECRQAKIYPDLPPPSGVTADGLTRSRFNIFQDPILDPRQLEVPYECVARQTIQFMTPIQRTKDDAS